MIEGVGGYIGIGRKREWNLKQRYRETMLLFISKGTAAHMVGLHGPRDIGNEALGKELEGH